MMEWLTLNVMRTLQRELGGYQLKEAQGSYWYSIPSLIVTGFFFVSVATFAGSFRSRAIVLPAGRVSDTSSRLRTVTSRIFRSRPMERDTATYFRTCSGLGCSSI